MTRQHNLNGTPIFTVAEIMQFFAKNQNLVNSTIELMYTDGSKQAYEYMRFNGSISNAFADVIMSELKYRLHWQ